VAAAFPLANLSKMGVSATCPDVASGGASQNSVPTCALVSAADIVKIRTSKDCKNLVILVAFDGWMVSPSNVFDLHIGKSY